MPEAGVTEIRSARPTFRVAGEDQPALSGGLLGLSIEESVDGLYRCEALFGNWRGASGFLYFDRRLLDFGKRFEVRLGADALFDGRIMALHAHFPEGAPPQLSLLAEDRLQDMRMTRRTRTFSDVSDRDLIGRIARDHGLTPDVSLDGPTHRVLAQVNQSDLAFLRERARAAGAEVWVEGSTLHVKARSSRGGSPLRLNLGARLREFSVIADLANQRTSVTVSGWDVGGKAELKSEADDAAIRGDLGSDESGASILRSAIGARKESVAHAAPLGSEEARAHAEAWFRRSARRFVVGRGVTETDARLRVGQAVDLEGLGPLFSGTYYVAEVRTRFDGSWGLRTEFTGERPGLGRP